MTGRVGRILALSGVLMAAVPGLAASVTAPPKPAATEDIRDIRGPVAIPPWWRWLAVGAAGVLVGGLAVAAYRQLRRRRARPLTAEERALQQLREARPLALSGQAREYAMAASEAIRQYIEARYGVQAAHATTEEFFETCVATVESPLAAHRSSLVHFLEACDLAKFGRFQLAREGMDSLDTLARTFVSSSAAPPAETRTS